jgi:hypothetical protein
VNYLIYDLEIIKAIPNKKETPLRGIEYCQGWTDYGNMGISVIGVGSLHVSGTDAKTYRLGEPKYLIADEYGLGAFERMVNGADGIIGFNSVNFDDKLMAAQGVKVQTTVDMLEELRISAYGSSAYQDCPKGHSYKLAAIGEHNGYPKTGNGENAAIQWQQGKHKEVIDYCLNDVKITGELMVQFLEGVLVDPNTDLTLRPRRTL